MKDRHARLLHALIDAVGGQAGALEPPVRQGLIAGRPTSGAVSAFAVKVAHDSASVRDEHVSALKAAGVSEEAIFEAVIASGIGAGMDRLRAVFRLLGVTDP